MTEMFGTFIRDDQRTSTELRDYIAKKLGKETTSTKTMIKGYEVMSALWKVNMEWMFKTPSLMKESTNKRSQITTQKSLKRQNISSYKEWWD